MLGRLVVASIPDSWRRPSLRRNVVMNWVSTVGNIGLSFLLIPLVVRTLDKELYGVWSFLNGLAAYSNLIYLGLGASFMKYFSEARGRADVGTLTRLLGVAFTLYAGLGTLCFLAGVIVSPFVPSLFATALSPAAAWAAKITAVLLGVRVLLFFIASAFSALLAAHGRMDLIALISLVGACLRTAAGVGAMHLSQPLVAMAGVVVAEAVYQLAALVVLCRVVAPSVRPTPAWPTWKELKGLYGFGFQAFFVQLAVVLIGYTDTALIGLILGASSVTLYSLPLQLVEYSRVLVNGVTLALLPELASSRARGDLTRLREVYIRAGRICAVLAVFINIHIVLFGEAFLGLWVGASFANGATSILIFLCISAIASALSTQVLAPFYQAFDVLKVLVWLILAEAASNVILSVLLSQTVGLVGVAMATAIPACVITMIFVPRYMVPKLGLGLRDFAQAIVRPALLVAVATMATQWGLSAFCAMDSYWMLSLRVACSAAVAAVVVVAEFPREDWAPFVPGLR